MANEPNVPQETNVDEDLLIAGHAYDGIREYDNDLPMWWTVLLVMSVFWALLYFVGITFTGNVNTYEEDLAYRTAEVNAVRAQAMAKMPALTDQSIAELLKNPGLSTTGNGLYATVCASCHGAKGEGGIGPNLTDAYWIHGGKDLQVFTTISKGVVDKGMAAWESSISTENRVALVAFIKSIQGTNPPNAKAPQGVKIEG